MYLDKRKRYVLYGVIAVVSIVALIIVICEEASSNSTPEVTPTPSTIVSKEGTYEITNSSDDSELLSEFNDLYLQKIVDDGTDVTPYIYSGENENIKDLITPGKGLTNFTWNKAEVDLYLPDLHVGNKTKESEEFIKFFDNFINGIMINDANSKIKADDSIKTYTGTYGAYVRTVTNSVSKEEIPVFSYMVKTKMYSSKDGENVEAYSIVYDLKNEKKLSLRNMLDLYGIDWRIVKDAVNSCINKANKNIDDNVYKRDNDEMFYNINENYNKYIVNEKGDIYIYFCYGNKGTTVTNAMDVVKITKNGYNKNTVKSKENVIENDVYETTVENTEVQEVDVGNSNNNELVEDVNAVENTAETTTQTTVENGTEQQATTENTTGQQASAESGQVAQTNEGNNQGVTTE